MTRTLYKYFPIRSELHLDRLDRLFQGQIHFGAPAAFNDPFELRPSLAAPRPEDIFEPMASAGFEYSKSAQRKFHEQLSAQVSRADAVSAEWMQDIGVLCLTTKPDNLLMWAHYASDHTGVCIGFSSLYAPFASAKPVNYDIERPKVRPFDRSQADEDLVQKVLFTKSSDWSYEAEWRAVKRPVRKSETEYYSRLLEQDSSKVDDIAELLSSEGGPGLYEFDTRALTRIYLGCRMDAQNRNATIERLKASRCRPHVFDLSVDSGYFRLNSRQVKRI